MAGDLRHRGQTSPRTRQGQRTATLQAQSQGQARRRTDHHRLEQGPGPAHHRIPRPTRPLPIEPAYTENWTGSRWGPHRIAYHLGLARSTVGRVLTRYNMPRLTEVDQATGLAVRRPAPVRYEKTSPGELVHLDINKLGRIPDGGGWRAHGRGSAPALAADRAKTRTRRRGGPVGGYRYIHHAVDDYSRLVYSEILDDERKETAAGFFQRANAFFEDLGVTVQAVMTDNGACYRSRAFNQVLSAAGIKHRYTRPYRPQTNGKVERFNRTLALEWAYAHTYTSQTQREAAYQAWLHHYNHHRPHTALDGQTPASRVHNLTGKYT
ncbi:IS481 family transposase [Actinomyces viscosus]|uniref:IS481 family transposase n=1 Tax=Actinomyces viscosus TaxID=1656 RepID=UPI0036F281CF